MSFFNELKRRNVLRVAAAYIVTAWLVIQVVETIFPAFGFGDVVVRYVTIAFAIGLLPALVVAWVFELTPEGLKKDAEVDHDRAFVADSAKRLDRIILVVLALALGYFAFDKFILAPQQKAEELAEAREAGRSDALVESYGDASIAVLAFQDMSPEQDQEYLSDGIAEEILHLLAQIPELRVISRSSAFSYKDRDVAIPIIAEQLNVAHVLEGSVRKVGDRIRITAQLIDGRSDTHIWSQSYDRKLDDVFAIQDELSRAMVEQLELKLVGEIPRSEPVDSEAYSAYLLGKHLLDSGQARESVEYLERAIEISPGFLAAQAALTTAYVFSAPTMGQDEHHGDEVFAKMVASFERLASLDADHPLVLSYAPWQLIEQQGDYATGAANLTRAVGLYPNDEEVLRSASYLASLLGKDQLAADLGDRLVQVNPLCARCVFHQARMQMRAERHADAVRVMKRFIEARPEAEQSILLGTAQMLAGNADEARESFERLDNPRWRRYGLALLVGQAGNSPPVRSDLGDLEANLVPANAIPMAALYAHAGIADDAFRLLESMPDDTANWRVGFQLRGALFRRLHDDPRWESMLARAGIAPHQVGHVSFNPPLVWKNQVAVDR